MYAETESSLKALSVCAELGVLSLRKALGKAIALAFHVIWDATDRENKYNENYAKYTLVLTDHRRTIEKLEIQNGEYRDELELINFFSVYAGYKTFYDRLGDYLAEHRVASLHFKRTCYMFLTKSEAEHYIDCFSDMVAHAKPALLQIRKQEREDMPF